MRVRFQPEIFAAADGPTGPSPASQPATTEQPAVTSTAPPPKSSAKRRSPVLRRLLIAALLIAAAYFGYPRAKDYVVNGWYKISTDDAYVSGDVSSVSAKVSGFITAFDVAENTPVKADTIIAEIDDGDYRLAVEAAERKVDTQKATLARFDSQLAQADASIAQSRNQIDAAQADVKRTEEDLVRYTKLTKEIGVTAQRLDQAQADRDRTRANVAAAQAGLSGAQAAKAVLLAQKKEAERGLDELQVQVEKAKRDLSFTKVRASVAGIFGNKSASVGTLAQAGTRLGALIADNSLYVLANFKETQIHQIHEGQAATVQIDALGGQVLQGTVQSFAPGSGATFSLLPPENATGNFTKIVQRVPVRIALPADQRTVKVLRPGLSVIVTIDTRNLASGGSSLADLPVRAANAATVK
jgi:membrane fusion protein, multidrug efflux system